MVMEPEIIDPIKTEAVEFAHVYCVGNDIGHNVIDILRQHGGRNLHNYDGKNRHTTSLGNDTLYYIGPKNIIHVVSCGENQELHRMIREHYNEVGPCKRVKYGTPYYRIYGLVGGLVVENIEDSRSRENDKDFDIGNYYLSKEEARQAICEIEAILRRNKENFN